MRTWYDSSSEYRSPLGRPHWGRSTNIMTTLMAERTLPTFEDFYRSHWHGAQRLATCVAGSAAAGEDIAQEVFQRMYRSWGHAEEPAAYLRVAIVNGCRSYHRRRRTEVAKLPMLATR